MVSASLPIVDEMPTKQASIPYSRRYSNGSTQSLMCRPWTPLASCRRRPVVGRAGSSHPDGLADRLNGTSCPLHARWGTMDRRWERPQTTCRSCTHCSVVKLPGPNGRSAAAKCSNQTDLHLTLSDPIRPTDLPQRPPLTAMPLATDQVVQRTAQFGSSQELSDEVSDNRHRQRWTPVDTHGRSVPGQACCGAGSPRLYLASGRRGRRLRSGPRRRPTADVDSPGCPAGLRTGAVAR